MGSRLGQHFLMHPQIAERIVHVAQVTKNDVVLEIGPGKGILTRALLAKAKKVIAVEADAGLAQGLEKTFEAEIREGRFELVFADIRLFDLTKLPRGYVVVANIPYYLTGDILRMLLSSPNQPGATTLLVQKEVAVRIARSKKESILSLSVKVYGEPKYEFTVPRGAFKPSPGVDSAVLSIHNISREKLKDVIEEERFFKLVKAGFAQKRKRLLKNLEPLGVTAGVPKNARAEDLSLANWLTLTR
jgi:16S rRNA (adenine1518-N6/adenine1519-N6)-dimethyltransferase